uniref:Putative secreted protein n=1 Tax=Anopheles marajoara TaxID=58244 RepID=A0A2M4CEK5_9DIPT
MFVYLCLCVLLLADDKAKAFARPTRSVAASPLTAYADTLQPCRSFRLSVQKLTNLMATKCTTSVTTLNR